jgi:phospholipase C
MPSIADVKHVVVLMQENRAFDEYFGIMRGVRGFFDPHAIKQSDGSTIFAQKSSTAPATLYPFHVDTHTTDGQKLPQNGHSWANQHAKWANGALTGWRADHDDTVMGYFDRYDIPYHTALAQSFTICDDYHCAVLGPTAPNRIYLMSGMIDPGGTLGGPQITNPGGFPATPGQFRWKSYPRALSDAGVSWAVYDEQAGHAKDPPFDLNVAGYFADWVESAATHRKGDHRFEADLANGTLPTISWIVPPYANTEHPSLPPADGAFWMSSKIDALINSPYWANTVFILTYDENDGAFDHVVPPTAPAGTTDEYVQGLPIGPGFRVPCIVISPWTVGGRVSSLTFDHTSVLRLMESVTGVQAENISAYRRAHLHSLAEALDFSSATAAAKVPKLPQAPQFVDNGLAKPTAPIGAQTWPPSLARLSAIGWPGSHAYFFKGDQYLRYVTGAVGQTLHPEAGYPKPIAGNWPAATFVDAGVAMPDGKAYVFSGNAYVRYTAPAGNPNAVAGDYTLDAGYPNPIWNNWGGFWAADLDAVVAWTDGFTYFFKATEYVRCPTNGHVADDRPLPIALRFGGVIEAFPFGIDGAVVWSPTVAYFFKGDQYLRYDIPDNRIEVGYPKALATFSPELAAL